MQQKIINNQSLNKVRFKYLTLITSIIVTVYLVTAVVQNRLVAIGDIDICAAMFVYPFSYLLFDICTEVYGYKITRQILWCCLLSWIFSGLLITMVIHLPAPNFWKGYSGQFNTVMSPYFRTVLSGIIAVIAGQFINIYMIAKFKVLTRGRFFWLRSVTSCFMGDSITTTFAIFFIFFGRMAFFNIIHIIIYQIIIAIVLQAVCVVPATIMVYFLKKSENIDVYDYSINFNPFKFSIEDDIVRDNEKMTA